MRNRLVLASASSNLNYGVLSKALFFQKKMATHSAASMPMSQPESQPESQLESQPETESDSDGEDFSDAPDMREYIVAKNALAAMNAERKDHLEILKRKSDELEDFMNDKGIKEIRIEGMVAQIKKRKKLSWSETSLREHADEDGRLDLDMYKTNQTEVVERMSIKMD